MKLSIIATINQSGIDLIQHPPPNQMKTAPKRYGCRHMRGERPQDIWPSLDAPREVHKDSTILGLSHGGACQHQGIFRSVRVSFSKGPCSHMVYKCLGLNVGIWEPHWALTLNPKPRYTIYLPGPLGFRLWVALWLVQLVSDLGGHPAFHISPPFRVYRV